MKQMVTNNIQFQQNVSATIQDLQTQIGQLATTVKQMQQQSSGNILAQLIINPQGNVCVITLRSGKELPNSTDVGAKIDNGAKTYYAQKKKHSSTFPFQINSNKKVELDFELLKTFRRVEVNIPLLDAIKQIPKYAKFLKDFGLVLNRSKSIDTSHRVWMMSLLERKDKLGLTPQGLPR